MLRCRLETAVEFAARATDDLSGVESMDISLISPGGSLYYSSSAHLVPPESASPDSRRDVTMQGSALPYQNAPSGNWTLSARITDSAGNYRELRAGDLAKLGLPDHISVAGAPDVTPPSLMDMTVSRIEVDARVIDQVVVVDVHATDIGGQLAYGKAEPGIYAGMVDGLRIQGRVTVSIRVDCPGTVEDSGLDFSLYIDPSGLVFDQNGKPVAGATVALFRSDTEGGPFTVVPEGSEQMSPDNRRSPDVTDAAGHYGWLKRARPTSPAPSRPRRQRGPR